MNILERANGLVSDIYKAMKKIESCEAIIEAIDGKEIVFLGSDDRVITLDGVIDNVGMYRFKSLIKAEILNSAEESRNYLSKLLGDEVSDQKENIIVTDNKSVDEKGTSEKKKVEKKSPERKSENEKKNADKKTEESKPLVELTKEYLKQAYVEEKKTLREISEETGYAKSTIYTKIQSFGLVRPRRDEGYIG